MELPSEFIALLQRAQLTNNQTWIRKPTMSKRVHEARRPGQRWDVKLATVNLDINEYFDLWPLALAVEQAPSFTAILPHYSHPRGTALGAPRAKADLAAGLSQMVIAGWQSNQPLALRRGDCFKFANHKKVYMCLTHAPANSIGEGQVTFIPELHHAVPANTTLIVKNVPFQLSTERRPQAYPLDAANGKYARIEIDCIEDL